MTIDKLNLLHIFWNIPKKDLPESKTLTVALKALKWGAATTSTVLIPRLVNKELRPLSATSSLTLLKGALFITLIYRITLVTYRSWHGVYKNKKEAINDLFSGSAATTADLTLVTAANLAYPYFFIHESGHYACAKAFFKEKDQYYFKPHKINIHPFVLGETSYTASLGLTTIGQWLGKERSMMIITAAGSLASTIYSCAAIILASRLTSLSHILTLHAMAQTIQELIYQTGFFKVRGYPSNHDLSTLNREHGIHPAIPIIFTVAAPIITHTIAKIWKKRRVEDTIVNTNVRRTRHEVII